MILTGFDIVSTSTSEDEQPSEDQTQERVIDTSSSIEDKTYNELKTLCSQNGLLTSGKKADLIERLQQFEAEMATSDAA